MLIRINLARGVDNSTSVTSPVDALLALRNNLERDLFNAVAHQ